MDRLLELLAPEDERTDYVRLSYLDLVSIYLMFRPVSASYG